MSSGDPAAAIPPTYEDVLAAAQRIAPYIHRTPVFTSERLDRELGARLYFKGEHLQKAGAFKSRGAVNAVFSLDAAALAGGVVTHSSGNHAAALARAAALRGVPARIVMPRNSPVAKQEAVRSYGGQIEFCEPTLAAREAGAARIQAEHGSVLIHPYNDGRVMAGQGTAALELCQQVPDLDAIVVPVGGGGLLSGTVIAAKGLRPGIRVFAAEPQGADDTFRSFQTRQLQRASDPATIADGLRTSLGSLAFPILLSRVDDVATVSEPRIVQAMRRIWQVLKQVVEPSAAVPLGALLEGSLPLTGRRVGVILSGGNLDLDSLPWS